MTKGVEDGMCAHDGGFDYMDPGPFSDDIVLKVCRKCKEDVLSAPVESATTEPEIEGKQWIEFCKCGHTRSFHGSGHAWCFFPPTDGAPRSCLCKKFEPLDTEAQPIESPTQAPTREGNYDL